MGDPAEARSLRARALELLAPLRQRGVLGLELRGLPERIQHATATTHRQPPPSSSPLVSPVVSEP